MVGNGRGRGRRKSKVRGQETTRPHTVSTHTCEPQLIQSKKKRKRKTGTHTFICRYVQTGSRKYMPYTRSHSTTGWHGLKRNTEKQRIGRGKPQTQGKQWGLMNPTSTISGYRSAVGETAVPYFLTDRLSWKIPTNHKFTSSFWVLWTQFPASTIVILHVIWFEFDAVLSIKPGKNKAFHRFDTCQYFSPRRKSCPPGKLRELHQ